MADKRALVIGANGFLGRFVARLYSRKGYTVHGLGHGRFTPDERRLWGVDGWHECDVTLDSLREHGGAPDVIVHCAGSGSVGFSMAEPLKDFERTVWTTAAVLEYARLFAKGARVVYPSSGGVYGAAERLPISEDAPLKPVSPYGVHKRMAEELCRSFGKSFGVASAVVRLFSVYGPGLRKQLLWDSCGKIGRGELCFWGTGEEIRDFLYIEDAAGLLYEAGQRASADSPVVNGGSGRGTTVREILGEVLVCFGGGGEIEFNDRVRPGDPRHYEADITKARGWGWSPQMALSDGVRVYVEWFRKGAK
jgi:UDP-glucose 4-epimerase